jgi:hypothetical protein
MLIMVIFVSENSPSPRVMKPAELPLFFLGGRFMLLAHHPGKIIYSHLHASPLFALVFVCLKFFILILHKFYYTDRLSNTAHTWLYQHTYTNQLPRSQPSGPYSDCDISR